MNSDSCEIHARQIFAATYESVFNTPNALNITITFKPFFRPSDTIAASVEIDKVFGNLFESYIICMESHKVDPTRKHYHCIGIPIGIGIKVPYIDKTRIRYKQLNHTMYNEIDISRSIYDFLNKRYGRSTVYWNSIDVSDDSTYESYLNYCLKDYKPIFLKVKDKFIDIDKLEF